MRDLTVNKAEIYDSVTLSIRIMSEINFSFNKLHVNFNETSFNRVIFDEDNQELSLIENNAYQNDLTIFISSQIKSELRLDYVVLEKISNGKTLSLIITPLPEINIDNLIFGESQASNTDNVASSNDESKDELRILISDTRQKINMNVNYKEKVFLGELTPIDIHLKCRPD